ncbi:MAG: hypothetical protein ACYDB1_10690 [Acidiferrobacteraceae bacterium]
MPLLLPVPPQTLGHEQQYDRRDAGNYKYRAHFTSSRVASKRQLTAEMRVTTDHLPA